MIATLRTSTATASTTRRDTWRSGDWSSWARWTPVCGSSVRRATPRRGGADLVGADACPDDSPAVRAPAGVIPSPRQAQPGVARAGDRGRTVRHLQLGQDGGDVVTHSLLRQDQPSCDLTVAEPGGEQLDDLPLALGQLGERLHPVVGRGPGVEVHDPAGHGGPV